VTTLNISNLHTEEAILAELGERLARYRLDRRITQADLAREAGVSKRTVERVEAGASAQMSSIIRILRVLDLLPGLEQLVPEPAPRPLDLLKLHGKKRQRATAKRKPDQSSEPWSWDDEA
jgi:transcriptional regulator with XRE-family HTH domain